MPKTVFSFPFPLRGNLIVKVVCRFSEFDLGFDKRPDAG